MPNSTEKEDSLRKLVVEKLSRDFFLPQEMIDRLLTDLLEHYNPNAQDSETSSSVEGNNSDSERSSEKNNLDSDPKHSNIIASKM